MDSQGNLYGATYDGGTSLDGTVFEVDSGGVETTLYTFTGGPDGCFPIGGLLVDDAGDIYGTTSHCGPFGGGTAFKLSAGVLTVLHNFRPGADGNFPAATLIRARSGNFYGTNNHGGSECDSVGCGVVFELSPSGVETVLHIFCKQSSCTDGGYPVAALIEDNNGNLYGTTPSFGAYGWGTVFKIDRSGKFTTLYSFRGGADGGKPLAGLVQDGNGNFYGTTVRGGIGTACTHGPCGVIFEVDQQGNETVLYSFTGGVDGGQPFGGLIQDLQGNLYGTTRVGGNTGFGTIFELTP
jgi:uncharacterized repeat protein (TIGR03803 family)